MRLIRCFSATRELLPIDRAATSAAPYRVPMPAPGGEVPIEPESQPPLRGLFRRIVRALISRRSS